MSRFGLGSVDLRRQLEQRHPGKCSWPRLGHELAARRIVRASAEAEPNTPEIEEGITASEHLVGPEPANERGLRRRATPGSTVASQLRKAEGSTLKVTTSAAAGSALGARLAA